MQRNNILWVRADDGTKDAWQARTWYYFLSRQHRSGAQVFTILQTRQRIVCHGASRDQRKRYHPCSRASVVISATSGRGVALKVGGGRLSPHQRAFPLSQDSSKGTVFHRCLVGIKHWEHCTLPWDRLFSRFLGSETILLWTDKARRSLRHNLAATRKLFYPGPSIICLDDGEGAEVERIIFGTLWTRYFH